MKIWELSKEDAAEIESTDTKFPQDSQSNAEALEMQKINKLIFVQDFREAYIYLKQFIHIHPENYEGYFRLVEVSWKLGELEKIAKELANAAQENPNNLPLQMGLTLAEIRCLEKTASEKDSELLDYATNNLDLNARDVIGLSAHNELSGLISNRSLPATPINVFSPQHQHGILRVSRNPTVADDTFIEESQIQPATWADMPHNEIPINETAEADCLIRAKNLSLQHPNNYAAWFINACALEYKGQLTDAVSAWIKAHLLEPTSVSVLSTLAELQQMGIIPLNDIDYSKLFESLDRFLVHGSLETHILLYQECMEKNNFLHSIAALRTLADWMQRQRGEVPPEIECLCLLGASKAYEHTSNKPAADACKKEAEIIVMAARASPTSEKQIKFLGELCQEFGLESLARSCYATAVAMPNMHPTEIVQIVSQCTEIGCNESMKEALQEAYRNHKGCAEIRFSQILCSVSIAKISIKNYTERKNQIRDCLQKSDITAAFSLLQESFTELDDDAEAHYYMAELLTRFGSDAQADIHFQKMQILDPYNADSLIRYGHFLLRIGNYPKAKEISDYVLNINWITSNQRAEFFWIQAMALFASAKTEEAIRAINASLVQNPWHGSYLSLAARLYKPQDEMFSLGFDAIIKDMEEALSINQTDINTERTATWIEIGKKSLAAGYIEFAYLIAKATFLTSIGNTNAIEFFIKTAAAINSRLAVQQLLLLLQTDAQKKLSLSHISVCVAQIYALDGHWSLCEEWIDISNKSGITDNNNKAKLLEIQALAFVLQGKELQKSIGLIEAAIDVYESTKTINNEAHLLHAYLLATQGEKRRAMEKVEAHLTASNSLQSLYFAYKTLMWCDDKHRAINTLLTAIFEKNPENLLEKKLIEDIFCISSKKLQRNSVAIAC